MIEVRMNGGAVEIVGDRAELEELVEQTQVAFQFGVGICSAGCPSRPAVERLTVIAEDMIPLDGGDDGDR